MTTDQKLLWGRMYRILEEFYEGRLPFREAVYRLDDAMDSPEMTEKAVVEQWRQAWEPLYQVDLELDSECACVDFDRVNPLLRDFAKVLVSTYNELDQRPAA